MKFKITTNPVIRFALGELVVVFENPKYPIVFWQIEFGNEWFSIDLYQRRTLDKDDSFLI